MIVAIPVAQDEVGHSWGRAAEVAVADVRDGAVADWAVIPVGWDVLHDSASHGSHHARVMTFLRDHEVAVVAAQHVGPGMVRMLDTAGIPLVAVGVGDAREWAVRAAAQAAG